MHFTIYIFNMESLHYADAVEICNLLSAFYEVLFFKSADNVDDSRHILFCHILMYPAKFMHLLLKISLHFIEIWICIGNSFCNTFWGPKNWNKWLNVSVFSVAWKPKTKNFWCNNINKYNVNRIFCYIQVHLDSVIM